MSRSIHFPVFVFLLLFALLFLLSGEFSRFSAPRSMLEFGQTIDRPAVEKGTLSKPDAVTKRPLQQDLSTVLVEIRRRLSGVGLFPHPIQIDVSENDQRLNPSVDAALNKITRKIRAVKAHLKDHVRSSFDAKSVSRKRPEVNFVTRIHCWLVGEFGHAHTRNGRPSKEIRTNARSIKKRLTSSRGSRVQGSRAELNLRTCAMN